MSWISTLSLIKTGDPVSDQTINKILLQLAGRTQYLKDRLDASATGEGITLFSRPLNAEVSEGDAVYYNSSAGKFKRAIATTAEASGSLRTANEAYVVGIVVRKTGSELGDIGIAGRFKGVTLQDADAATLQAGHYYLSSSDAGKLVDTRPAVGVYVGQVTSSDDGEIIVNPTPREVLEEHVHYKFDIAIEAAGTVLCLPDNCVDIVYSEDILGWLPADHAVFGGGAPQGAFFGYNIWKDPELAAVWPPEPVQSAYVEFNGAGVPSDFVRVDKNGLWWMTNCADNVPFKQTECTSSSVSPSEQAGSSSSAVAATGSPCAAAEPYITMWFTRMVAKTNLAVVTGIKAAADEPIEVVSCADPDTDGFCRGKVELALNMPWTRTTGISGSEVVKSIAGKGLLGVGHVVEGVKGAGLVSASGSVALSDGYQSGTVVLTGIDPTSVTRTVDVTLVALDGAVESVYAEVVPYVGLVANRDNSFVGRVRVPTLSMDNPMLRLSFDFAMPTAGTPPTSVTVCYAKISASTLTGESSSALVGGGFATLPTAWSSAYDLMLDDLGALSQGEHFRRNVYEIGVSSDEIFLFKLRRALEGGYSGELAIVNMFATIYEG